MPFSLGARSQASAMLIARACYVKLLNGCNIDEAMDKTSWLCRYGLVSFFFKSSAGGCAVFDSLCIYYIENFVFFDWPGHSNEIQDI